MQTQMFLLQCRVCHEALTSPVLWPAPLRGVMVSMTMANKLLESGL